MQRVLILDFGSQYTQLIARKIRELGVYSEILPFSTPLAEIRRARPSALVLSGGPQSVYGKGAPHPDKGIFELGVPVLGICYGVQLMAHFLGGQVIPSKEREYGFAALRVVDRTGLLAKVRDRQQVWMSHGDRLDRVPPGFRLTGSTANTRAAVIEDPARKFYGVQFHPEVIHTREGLKVLGSFLFGQAGLKPDWSMSSFVARKVREIKETVGDGKVICGLSGGVDSLVTSLLIHKAIGNRLTCIFIDNGLLRKGQYETLMEAFRHKFALKVVGIDASDMFLDKLRGVVSPERKRKTIGRLFIHLFEREAMRLGGAAFLAQGTIYPDVIESNPVKGPSSVIKSHHNVGGLPKGLKFKLVEPLRELFKDEVRALALELGVDEDFIHQHPFPGPGLAVRLIGQVDRESLEILRAADDIVLQEVQKAGIYKKLWQAFAVLLPVRSVGVMGDERTYQRVVAVRMVQSTDGMTANWYPAPARLMARISTRIVNEVRGVNRVVYDVTTKPPGTIEWE
ncbi:MAG TPA: glutamine-hydrolyzing GMP synthase [Candidatus Aminicenantes bacterium]|nr:glutamine-hydrolyzing GMP synthase [Candidatus Aminicenantes bacterium]HRY64136.1 glutamine-hydrolyzing GMP synthase [Candidatus Aminicenantes bacterium]HRZ71049.1 glutamine-hydrolyzing GMP synthase [Candidatus Aminicenantes bacterium]